MRRWVSFSIAIMTCLSLMMTNCDQYSALEKTRDSSESSKVEEVKRQYAYEMNVPHDFFFSDAVVTATGAVVTLGLNNQTVTTYANYYAVHEQSKKLHQLIHPITNDTFYLLDIWKFEEYIPASNPSWVPSKNSETRKIQSMCMNCQNFDIYLLTEKSEPLCLEEADIRFVNYQGLDNTTSLEPDKDSTTHMEESEEESSTKAIFVATRYRPLSIESSQPVIEVVRGDDIVKEYSIDDDKQFTRIQYCHVPETNKEYLLALDVYHNYYSAEITEAVLEFDLIQTSFPPFHSWELSGDTLLLMDTTNTLHFYTAAFTGDTLSFQEKETLKAPFEEKMNKPVLQYNPISKGIVLWDAIFNGKTYVATFHDEEFAWKWKQLKVTPMSLFMFSDELLQKGNDTSPDEETPFWSSKDHAYYYGVPPHQSRMNLYRISTEVY
ncbi:MAG: hypothetical protein PHI40_06895 [Caldisericia bacterium]|nr:hypothetical protein [Caldisericia bacterium]MDD4615112.1 hypothetical protein [Caldisericia bacterium]